MNCIHPFEAPENVFTIFIQEKLAQKKPMMFVLMKLIEFNDNLPEGFRSRLQIK